jgi:hypothetical protein
MAPGECEPNLDLFIPLADAAPFTRETRMSDVTEVMSEEVTLTLSRGELMMVTVALEERELKLWRDAGNGNPAFGRINPALWTAKAKAAEHLAERLRSLALR